MLKVPGSKASRGFVMLEQGPGLVLMECCYIAALCESCTVGWRAGRVVARGQQVQLRYAKLPGGPRVVSSAAHKSHSGYNYSL